MADLFLLSFIAVWIIVAAIARHRENRKLWEITKPLLEEQSKIFKSMLEKIEGIKGNSEEAVKFMREVIEEETTVPPEATRVYAAILRQGLALRLHMLPAVSISDFVDKSKAIVGSKWDADVIEYLDVYEPKEKVIGTVFPTKKERKQMGLTEGLHFLMLTRDKFAKGEQKEAMDEVITNYKKTYELA